MKRTVIVPCILAFSLALAFIGCKKQTDDGPFDVPADYFRDTIGKYIIYRLDSTKFTNYGLDQTITTYQAKDVVMENTTDLLGRPSWRIQRYIRPFTSTSENDWQANIAYLVTLSENSTMEVVENNLRYVKLQGPLRAGHTWLGNGYLPDDPYSAYEFSAAVNIQYWNYSVDESGVTADINDKLYDSVITVSQIDDSTNVPVTNTDMIGQKMRWREQYAKHIGLVSKEVILWEYQPGVNSSNGYTSGFGIKLSILDHN